MNENFTYTVVLITFTFCAQYGVWCLLRGTLLRIALFSVYERFASKLEQLVEEETIITTPELRRILESRVQCWHNAMSLNAFTVAGFSIKELRNGLKGEVGQFVPDIDQVRVREAIESLRKQKCDVIEFYIKYCRISGYLWLLITTLKRAFGGIETPNLRLVLPALMDTLLDESVSAPPSPNPHKPAPQHAY